MKETSRFNYLLSRYLTNEATHEEHDELMKLIHDGANDEFIKSQIDSVLAQEGDGEDISIERAQAILSKIVDNEKVGKAGRQVHVSLILKIAASLLLFVAVGYGTFQYYQFSVSEKYALTEIQSGATTQKVILSDSSIIWLKSNSKLTYQRNFKNEGERHVTLHGEALFEVAKNPARPFIVHSGDITTTVLGTSFNIRNEKDHTEVFVFTGKVSVATVGAKKKIELLPTEKAIYTHHARLLTKVEDDKEHNATEYIKGTEYSMAFFNTRLSEIAKRIETKFNVTVKVNSGMNECLITADFTDQSLTSTLDLIAEALNASYSIEKNIISMTGKGCQ